MGKKSKRIRTNHTTVNNNSGDELTNHIQKFASDTGSECQCENNVAELVARQNLSEEAQRKLFHMEAESYTAKGTVTYSKTSYRIYTNDELLKLN